MVSLGILQRLIKDLRIKTTALKTSGFKAGEFFIEDRAIRLSHKL